MPLYRDASFVQHVGERATADWIRGLRPLFDDAPHDVEEKRCAALQFAFGRTIGAVTAEEGNALDRTFMDLTRFGGQFVVSLSDSLPSSNV